MNDDLGDLSMTELFKLESENLTAQMSAFLVELERDPASPHILESLMRAAHSIKGAARIVNISAVVSVAHAMEDCFVSAQKGQLQLGQSQIDVLLSGVDLLSSLARDAAEFGIGLNNPREAEIDIFLKALISVCSGEPEPAKSPEPAQSSELQPNTWEEPELSPEESPPEEKTRLIPKPLPAEIMAESKSLVQNQQGPPSSSAVSNAVESQLSVRVSADNMNRLMGLAGESMVHARWIMPFGESLHRLKRHHAELARSIDLVREMLSKHSHEAHEAAFVEALEEAKQRSLECQRSLAERLMDLDLFDRRLTLVSDSLYESALACRMRPFSEGAHGFARMVRDLSKVLGKQARFEVRGSGTRVDRDILEKLDAPLTHLLRNALDHGVETPEVRRAAGKPDEAVVFVEARHSAGMLLVVVCDDGRGVEFDKIRQAVVRRQLSTAVSAEKLSEAELLDFLFLPGFSMKETVSEISGRGVGLDVVREMVKQVRGKVRVMNTPGMGIRFQMELPLTLSVIRALMVEIAGQPYAFPLAGISKTAKINRSLVHALEGRPVVELNEQQIGLVHAVEVLDLPAPPTNESEWCIVLLERGADVFAMVVDRFLGEREVVVHPLDPRLGRIHDISAGTILDDGSPALIIDVEDMIHSIEARLSGGGLKHEDKGVASVKGVKRKRVLVVDDSLTVRELERKLLEARGYEVEVAVDGREGWTTLGVEKFDLIISDVDMPRMDGIELVTMIKKDIRLAGTPVMIVSYKDREEDRRKGLEAGADYYLGKGSFHDETLVNAVADLIGPAN